MKLYVSPFAPNVQRVEIVMLEKGITAETVDITTDRAGYSAINPLGQVPALLLDDGRVLTESLVIARYLDSIGEGPSLLGDDDDERLTIAMWERRAEMALFNPAVEYGHQVHPLFAQWIKQFPDYAATLAPKMALAARVFDAQLERTPYVAGDRFTAADITAMLGWFMGSAYGAIVAADYPALGRWSAELMQRPCMEPIRATAAAFGVG